MAEPEAQTGFVLTNDQHEAVKLLQEFVENTQTLVFVLSGYAVTCHKAQGGEWNEVFLIIEKSLWHPANHPGTKFRWLYTALTRSKRNLYILDNIAIV